MINITDKNRKLFEIAEAQQGLFTAKQAEEAGFINTNHVYHVKAGHWIRMERGIYRLSLFPFSPDQHLVMYALWSRNREGKIEGTYSHETALNFFELSDVNPPKIHMTVPTDFRRSSHVPKVIKLYFADLTKEDFKKSRGFYVTSPLRTLQDVIQIQNISFEFIEQAIKQALDKGLIRRTELKTLSSKISQDNVWRSDLDQTLKEIA
jgi:predicted transcriptional regulator of viral defense system